MQTQNSGRHSSVKIMQFFLLPKKCNFSIQALMNFKLEREREEGGVLSHPSQCGSNANFKNTLQFSKIREISNRGIGVQLHDSEGQEFQKHNNVGRMENQYPATALINQMVGKSESHLHLRLISFVHHVVTNHLLKLL